MSRRCRGLVAACAARRQLLETAAAAEILGPADPGNWPSVVDADTIGCRVRGEHLLVVTNRPDPLRIRMVVAADGRVWRAGSEGVLRELPAESVTAPGLRELLHRIDPAGEVSESWSTSCVSPTSPFAALPVSMPTAG